MSNKISGHKLSKDVAKRVRQSVTLDKKMEVIRRMEGGQKRAAVSKIMNLPPSTITTIMKNADKIKESAQNSTPTNATNVSYKRSRIFEKMEKLLSLWIDDLSQKNIHLTQAVITEKAKTIFEELKVTEGSEETFLGSTGWFMRFKARSNCRSVKIDGEAVSADVAAADAFSKEFQECVEEGNYLPDLIFNVDETVLYWKKLPAQNFTSQELFDPSVKPAKDMLTLLIGANVSGTLKLKPILVYNSETPRAFKGLDKDTLPVFWKSNKRARITQEIFRDWYTNYFCPTVLRFCTEYNLPPKAILLIDNAPGHPPNLEKEKVCLDVKVVYMPPNTTTILQPMNQGVISTFKSYYLRTTFTEMVRVLDSTNTRIKDYWQSYDILKAISNIKAAWDEVSVRSLNGVWRKLLPELVQDYKELEDVENVVEDISRLAKEVGLDDVAAKDVQEDLDRHDRPLSNEELQELSNEPSFKVREEENVKEETRRVLSTLDLERILTTSEAVTDELCEIDYDWERSLNMKKSVIASIRPYSELLMERKRKSRKLTLDNFIKVEKGDPTPNTSTD